MYKQVAVEALLLSCVDQMSYFCAGSPMVVDGGNWDDSWLNCSSAPICSGESYPLNSDNILGRLLKINAHAAKKPRRDDSGRAASPDPPESAFFEAKSIASPRKLFQPGPYTLRECLGSGTFGTVCRVEFPDGSEAAVKIHQSTQRAEEERKGYQDAPRGATMPLSYSEANPTHLGLPLARGTLMDLRRLLRAYDELPSFKDSKVTALRLGAVYSLLVGYREFQKVGLSHGDLKEANILVVDALSTAVFADLQTVRPIADLHRHSHQNGTFEYMAPELLAARRTYAINFEAWSIGKIGAEMLTSKSNALDIFDMDPAIICFKKDLIRQHSLIFDNIPPWDNLRNACPKGAHTMLQRNYLQLFDTVRLGVRDRQTVAVELMLSCMALEAKDRPKISYVLKALQIEMDKLSDGCPDKAQFTRECAELARHIYRTKGKIRFPH